jgi:hypothetical protein
VVLAVNAQHRKRQIEVDDAKTAFSKRIGLEPGTTPDIEHQRVLTNLADKVLYEGIQLRSILSPIVVFPGD